MILHPGVLALLVGGAASLFLVVVGAFHAVEILRRWDFRSASEEQLALERRTYLVSTTVTAALAFEGASALLFVYTVDDLHGLLTGAMCATGSLNANPVGWWALAAKLVLVFAGGLWIAVNRLDGEADDYPLARPKYAALLLLLPLVAADLWLEASYFLGLKVGAITSCCGSLFEGGGAVASTVASLPPRPMLGLFYATFALVLATGWAGTRGGRRPALVRAHGALAALSFPVALASIVSFVSIYLYELPTHHCPFDFLQAGYGYIGYPLYGSLFLGSFFGTLPGALAPLGRRGSLAGVYGRRAPRWLRASLAFNAAFVLLVTAIVLRSHYTVGDF